MRPIQNVISCLFVAAIICIPAAAQTNPNLELGIKAYGSYDGFAIDTVDLMNRNLMIKIPTVSYPQRGSLTAKEHFIYNSKQWRVSEQCSPGSCTSRWLFTAGGQSPISGWLLDAGFKRVTPPAVDLLNYYVFSVADASGNTHMLSRGGSDPAHSGYTLFYALDGSGYMLSTDRLKSTDNTHLGDPIYTYQNNGNNLPGSSVYIEDSNGNKITTGTGSTLIDTAGRVLPNGATITDATGCGGTLPVTTAYLTTSPGPSNGTTQIKTCYATVSLKTAFNATDENGLAIQEYQGSVDLIQSLIVYDGNSWTTSPHWIFQYANNSDGTNYGDITQLTLPTGGTLSYTWETVNWFDSACGVIGTPSHTPASRGVVTRSQDAADGSGPQTWNYKAPSTVANQWGTGVGVSDPMGNEVVHYFAQQGSYGCDLREDYTQYYTGMQSTGTLQKTVQTTYRYTNTGIQDPSGNGTTLGVYPSVITTTLPNNKVSQVQRDYVDTDGVTGTVQGYAYLTATYYSIPVGNLIEERVYDYGNGAPGPLLKKTHYTYKAWPAGGNSYSNLNMLDRVASVTVYDGSSNKLAQTTYGYDEYGLQASGISSTYLDTTVPSTRGNQTSASQWVSNSASNLVSTTSYFDSGMPYQSSDPNGNVTTYAYGSMGLYLTQTNMPKTGSVTHVVSATYDFNTGQVLSFTDQNNQTSSYTYDALSRIQSATFPDSGGTNFYYPDFVTIERTQKIDGSRTTDEWYKFDGLGRPIRTAKFNDQSPNYDQADTCYNGDGTVRFKSYPYQGSGFSTGRVCSGAGDSYTYDGLQRALAVTHADGSQVQNQYTNSGGQNTAAVLTRDEGNGSTQVARVSQSDVLGRLISVCEVSSTTQLGLGSTPGSCGQDIGATGFLTTYSYDALGNLKTVSQGGNLNRSFSYDGLSRLVSANNPESGTTNYVYDSNSACSGSPFKGDLVSKTDARGIRTCYQYDALHRTTNKSYSDGTTPAATFNYDESTVAGQSTVNPIGHLTTETTPNTGTYFWNFDAMGRPQGMSQCTPRTCGSSVYQTNYTYDSLGDTKTTVLPASGPTLTYTFNKSARLVSVASSLNDANHPGMLLSSLTYGPFGVASEQVGNLATEQMNYQSRGWVSSIAATGVSSTPSSGSITVNGSEQNRTSSSATPGQGSVTLSGSERSTQIQTAPATHSSGSITINGSEQKTNPGDCPNHTQCLYDSGTCTVTVAGIPASYNYGQGDTGSSIALALTNFINSHAPINTYVSASASGYTVSLTSVGTGSATNYSLSSSCTYDTTDFTRPSFTPSSVGMSGGLDAAYTTIYDTGTVGITVNGYNKTVSYNSGSNSTLIASALASAFHNDGAAPVDGTSSGAVVTLTSRVSGAGTNYSLTASSATNSGYFTGTSFPASPSGANLTGGTDATIQYDTGTVTATINGTQSTTTYGQGDSSTTVAGHLAAAISANSPVVNASSSGNVVTLTSKTSGLNTNYSVSASSASTAGFSPVSFTTTASGMSGGTGGSLYSVGLSYFNDGNINTSADSVNSNWVYTYDDLNRVKTAVASAVGRGCSWEYDRFGNRWHQNTNQGTCPFPQYSSTGGNNRIDNATYDAAGNYTQGGYTYDAENRLVTAPGGYSYVYDAEGRRVAKKTSGTITNEYLLDASGGQLVELDGSGNVLHTNIFANGQLIATYKNDGQTYFHFNDWLGNRRFQTNAAGDAPHTMTCTNYPYGDLLSCSGSGVDATEHHFTGKERDTETGLDNFGARYYASSMGRFVSADPSGLLAQKPESPQSWNLYAYARNSPVIFLDPNGLDCVYANDTGDDVESIDHNSNSGECGSNGGSWVPGYAAENWAHFNNNTGQFQVGSINGSGSSATVDYTTFGAGAQTQFNGDESACLSGCSGFGLANADWLQSQLVGNSAAGGLDGYIHFLTGRELQLSTFSQIAYGPLDYSMNNWAGPGGFGVPSGEGDWRASMHDYNFNTNGITIGSYFNPSLSPATSRALIQSNNYLMQTGGYQGTKEKIFFGVVNAFQWASHLF
jgi:RHS repeat-associated protein